MNKKYLLIGNPNVGKTTIFNNLTGLNEKVSNFEGVTVTKKEGIIKTSQDQIIDLPGLNNLNDNSLISILVSNELSSTIYDSIVYVVDSTNIKRSLYMLIDILETKRDIKLLLNMNDIFKGTINIKYIEENLGLKAYKVSKNDVIDFKNIKSVQNNFSLTYDKYIEDLISQLLKYRNNEKSKVDDRYLTLQLIKKSEDVQKYFENIEEINDLIDKTENEIIKNNKAHSISGLIFKNKRQFINEFLNNAIKDETDYTNKISTFIDKIALHKFWGFVLFAFIMWIIFLISFQFAFLGDYVDSILQFVITNIDNFLTSINMFEPIQSFIVNGFLAGIASILVFLPQIIIMFGVLTLLEGSGYFSRVSILFGNLFDKIGLSAHSLIPLVSGLGCNVLSIMATRTIKNENNRIATILAAPYISCSARFPVYLIFIEIFFKHNKALILLNLYLLGIIVAIIVAIFVDKVIYKNQNTKEIAIIQLNSYKLVSLKYFITLVWKKVINFVLKAGKLILIGTVIIWLLTHFGIGGYTTNIVDSFLYQLSLGLSFVLRPLGFGTAEAASSLIAAFFAKELAISSMVVSYGASTPDGLSQILQFHFDVASAYSYMVFTLLYIPCIATLGAIYSETKKISLVIYSIVISLSLGYLLAFIAYNIINLFV